MNNKILIFLFLILRANTKVIGIIKVRYVDKSFAVGLKGPVILQFHLNMGKLDFPV